jgi:cobalt/nickel transport system ATP-binding protein
VDTVLRVYYNDRNVSHEESAPPVAAVFEAELALEVSGLRFSYPDTPDVLRGVSIAVRPGEKVGLIGPNGSGKTTFFLQVCGVLKPSSGQVLIFGRPVINGSFRPEVGLVFQNPNDQLFCPSVRDDVAFGPRNMGLSKEEVGCRVSDALRTVGHLDLADRPSHHLSEGEKRMVSIAGVLAMQPRLILCDEPSANLDIRSRRKLITLLEASAETLLIASHDLELILEICSRVLLMDEGRIVADGRPAAVMSDDSLMEAHGQEKPHSLVPHAVRHQHHASTTH